MPGWRRAVVGRTWPAWRPHSQIDHILVRGALRPVAGAVLPHAGSDHRPVRAEIASGTGEVGTGHDGPDGAVRPVAPSRLSSARLQPGGGDSPGPGQAPRRGR